MAEEDVGRIVDFTRASAWEEFVGTLEEALRLPSQGDGPARLETRVALGGQLFELFDHRIGSPAVEGARSARPPFVSQMLDRSDGSFRLDGRFGTERIRRWFGVTEYVVLCPAEGISGSHELESQQIAFVQVRCRRSAAPGGLRWTGAFAAFSRQGNTPFPRSALPQSLSSRALFRPLRLSPSLSHTHTHAPIPLSLLRARTAPFPHRAH
jgi:hypothetical protein